MAPVTVKVVAPTGSQAGPKLRAAVKVGPGPLFQGPEVEGPARYAAAYKHNSQWAKPSASGYQTQLNGRQENHFRDWLHNHAEEGHLPGGFNPNARKVDYDLRGYWLAHANAGTLANASAGEGGIHFTDRFKTPYDTTFSNESKYAKKGTPFEWKPGKNGWVLKNRNNGRVIVRESEE